MSGTLTVFVDNLPGQRRITSMVLSADQRRRLMDGIAARTHWINQPAPSAPAPDIVWSANDCRASMFQPEPSAP